MTLNAMYVHHPPTVYMLLASRTRIMIPGDTASVDLLQDMQAYANHFSVYGGSRERSDLIFEFCAGLRVRTSSRTHLRMRDASTYFRVESRKDYHILKFDIVGYVDFVTKTLHIPEVSRSGPIVRKFSSLRRGSAVYIEIAYLLNAGETASDAHIIRTKLYTSSNDEFNIDPRCVLVR